LATRWNRFAERRNSFEVPAEPVISFRDLLPHYVPVFPASDVGELG
jgi:hypothetical protein